MDPFTLAGIATIVLTGALTRVGEITLDGAIARLNRLIETKSPDTFKKLQSATPETLPETIEMMATLIDNDTEVKAIAQQVAQENESKPYVINMMKNVGIVNQGVINNPTFNFN